MVLSLQNIYCIKPEMQLFHLHRMFAYAYA